MISATGHNLIFILSQPRAGSTLLSAILGNHGQVYCPPEPWILLRLAETYGSPAEGKIFDDVLASRATKDFIQATEFMGAARAFAQSAYNSVLARSQCSLLVDKTPRYYHILDFIERLFPDAKKIWLKRNPLDVAASYKTNWNRAIASLAGEVLEPSAFDFIVALSNLRTFFDHPSANKIEIKYEDLVQRSEQETQKLCQFCGIEFDAGLLDLQRTNKGVQTILKSGFGDKTLREKSHITTDSVDCWRTQLSPEESMQLTRSLGRAIFQRMGYGDIVQQYADLFPAGPDKDVLSASYQTIMAKHADLKPALMATIYHLETQVKAYENQLREKAELLALTQKNLELMHAQLNKIQTRLSYRISNTILHPVCAIRNKFRKNHHDNKS